jgi:hypothetical protein
VGSETLLRFVAPVDARRHYYKGQKVEGWAGPGKGVVEMPAENWHPYSPYNFITPPFPGYVSGHSTGQRGCRQSVGIVHRQRPFRRSRKTERQEKMTESNSSAKMIQMRLGQIADRREADVRSRARFADFFGDGGMAGISRVMGGYHIQADNIAGLDLGRKVSVYIYPKIASYFDGTAKIDSPKGMIAAK